MKHDYEKEPYLNPISFKVMNPEVVKHLLTTKGYKVEIVSDPDVENTYRLLCKDNHSFWTADFIRIFIEGVDAAASYMKMGRAG